MVLERLSPRRAAVDKSAMAADDTLTRLRALSERLDRIRRQAREVHALAADEVRLAYAVGREPAAQTDKANAAAGNVAPDLDRY
jgi:hypothetical protein